MKEITRIEETILLSIFRLKDHAYGVTIKDQINKLTGREYLYSTLYTTLEQLVRKGLIVKRFGDPSPMRGGKRKIYFNLTEDAIKALKNIYTKHKSIWSGITKDTLSNSYLK